MSSFIGYVSTGGNTWINGVQYSGSPLSTHTNALSANELNSQAEGSTVTTLQGGQVQVVRIRRMGTRLMKSTILFANKRDATEIPQPGRSPQEPRRASSSASSSKSSPKYRAASSQPTTSVADKPSIQRMRSSTSPASVPHPGEAFRLQSESKGTAPASPVISMTRGERVVAKKRAEAREAYLTDRLRRGKELQEDLARLQQEYDAFDREQRTCQALAQANIMISQAPDRGTEQVGNLPYSVSPKALLERVTSLAEWKKRLESRQAILTKRAQDLTFAKS